MLRDELNTHGIVAAQPIYGSEALARLNAELDPHFVALAHEKRSYAYPADLERLGLLDAVLDQRVQKVLFDAVADPVLYHLHIYEIEGRADQPHIFAEDLRGWHRDPDSAYERDAPTHVSLFVHLTDVEADSGPFEFAPQRPTGVLPVKFKVCSMTGPAGSAYLWHRRFYHRAAPNRSAVRRRMLKISVQQNRFSSVHLQKGHLAKVAEQGRERNMRWRLLFGGFQSAPGPTGVVPPDVASPAYDPVVPNAQAGLDPLMVMKAHMKRPIQLLSTRQLPAAAYD